MVDLLINHWFQEIVSELAGLSWSVINSVLKSSSGNGLFHAQQSLGAVGSAIAAYLETKGMIEILRVVVKRNWTSSSLRGLIKPFQASAKKRIFDLINGLI